LTRLGPRAVRNVIIFAPLRMSRLEQAACDLHGTRSTQGQQPYKTLVDAAPKSKSCQLLAVANRRL
jgi:hypothetical protein